MFSIIFLLVAYIECFYATENFRWNFFTISFDRIMKHSGSCFHKHHNPMNLPEKHNVEFLLFIVIRPDLDIREVSLEFFPRCLTWHHFAYCVTFLPLGEVFWHVLCCISPALLPFPSTICLPLTILPFQLQISEQAYLIHYWNKSILFTSEGKGNLYETRCFPTASYFVSVRQF